MILVLNECVKFFPKFFLEIFHEYVMFGIVPPIYLSKCHIWGGYGGGEGVRSPIEGYVRIEGSPIKLLTI
jgi:hypothetical protein